MKNHDYKSLEDVLRAMLDGQVFWFGRIKIFFDKESVQPFIFGEKSTNQFTGWKNWKIKHWTDKLSPENPVLCWVSDEKHCKDHIALITGSNGITLTDITDESWNYVEPVKPEECWQGD